MPIRYPGSDAGRLAANVLIAHRRSSSGTSRRAAAKIASRDAASTARSLRSAPSRAVGPSSSDPCVVGTQWTPRLWAVGTPPTIAPNLAPISRSSSQN